MKVLLFLAVIAGQSFASEAEARAQAAYAASMGEPNVIQFDTSSLAKAPAGEWRTVQVCDGNGRCHLEQRWFPAQGVGFTGSTVAGGQSQDCQPPESGINDALDELNAQRAQRGLRPYIRDSGLTAAAQACADVRAKALCFGHTQNDFAALPAGTQSSASGCAAWYPGEGFGACGVYDNYTYAGAAFTMGADGKRYMHAFYR